MQENSSPLSVTKARSSILVLVQGSKLSENFDDRGRDLLESSESGLISSRKITWLAVVQTLMYQDAEFELDALGHSVQLKLIVCMFARMHVSCVLLYTLLICIACMYCIYVSMHACKHLSGAILALLKYMEHAYL